MRILVGAPTKECLQGRPAAETMRKSLELFEVACGILEPLREGFVEPA